MSDRSRSDKLLRIVIFAGLIIAVLAAIESQVEWLSPLCGFFGGGCRETEHITLLKMPIAYWGIGYYLILALAFHISRRSVFFLVMGGVGFEMILISMMIEMRLSCIYCFMNIAVVFLMVILSFEKDHIWQALTLSFLIFMVSDHLLAVKSSKQEKAVLKAPEPSVVAMVGSQEIRTRELEVSLSSQIYKLEQQIYELKRRRLEYMINNRLIEMDAREKGLSPEVVMYNVMNEGTSVTDQDVDDYYQANKDRISMGDLPYIELREKIRSFLKEKKTTAKINEYADPLRVKYNVKVFLTPPELPMTQVSEGSSPAMGPADAPVTVVEYSDYECPSCRKTHEVVKKIRDKFHGKIRWIFKDFPLDRHKHARYMAQAARCAADQDRFWDFQDLMYGLDKDPDPNLIKQEAESLGLDSVRFSDCLDSGKKLSFVEKDKQEGKEAGVSSTPTFVINGRLRPGYISFEMFSDLIQGELDKGL